MAAAAAALLCSCAVPQPGGTETPPGLTQIGFSELPGWRDDPAAEALPALAAQCRRLTRLPPDTALGGQALAQTYAGQAGVWAAPSGAMPPMANDATARRFVEAWFQPYRMAAPAMLTGYYEPVVRGSFTPGPAYPVPVLGRPDDLVSGQAYATRQAIEAGHFRGRTLLYLASPVDLFFLQIQGAGQVVLPDGGRVRLAFAASNGRPYTPIGRVLVQMRAMADAEITMQSIRAWLAAHPEQAAPVMDRNEHYVFFRIAAGAAMAGPPGTLGVGLTPGRSAAVDRHYVPLGAPLFLVTRNPVSGGTWRHLVLAQDTGSDVKGPARADIFLGAGPAAERMAGQMHEPGTLYLLLPRPIGARLAVRGAEAKAKS